MQRDTDTKVRQSMKLSWFTLQQMPQYTIFNIVALVHGEYTFPSADS
jgi:hypothetical protein